MILDEATGVYWNWKKAKLPSEAEAMKVGYTAAKKSYKAYVGQRVGDKVYKGFKPDVLNKSGYLEFYSDFMEEKGLSAMPVFVPIAEHEKRGADDLILTTYKVAVQIHSRSSHCKWLSEIYHDNPARLNPKTAAKLGIADGDAIKVRSGIGEITTKARLTEGIVPGVVAISHHVGRWECGRYASGKKTPFAHDDDPDLALKWWDQYGVHPNWIIPNAPDRISGQLRWMDTVVKVIKA